MSLHPIYQISLRDSAIRQGEILTEVVQLEPDLDQASIFDIDQPSFKKIIHPYAVVISQDCHLDWDYVARSAIKLNSDNVYKQQHKLLNEILLCEVQEAKIVRNYENVNRKEWELVASRRHERFYFFQAVPSECDLEQKGLPELTADFKRVFGITPAYLHHLIDSGIAQRRTVLVSPYSHDLSHQYHSFQGRVALPLPHESIKET